MKIIANAADLRSVLKRACEVVPSKGIIPEQSCVFIQSKDDAVTVSGQSETAGVTLSLSCDVLSEGEALVPSRMLLDYVSLAEGSVELSLDAKNVLTVKSGKKKSTVACLETDRFRPLTFEGSPVFSAKGADLAACIDRVSFAVSADETRAVLCGVHITVDCVGKATFVALDGLKVSLCEMKVAGANVPPEGLEITVPGAALKLITSLFSGAESVSLSLEKYRAMLYADGCSLSFPLIAKEYPQWQRIIPPNYGASMRVSARPLLDALSLTAIAASASAKNRQGLVRLDADGEASCIRFSVTNDVTEAGTDVDCDMTGQDMTIYFNVKFMQAVCSACAKDDGELRVDFSTPTGPCRVSPLRSDYSLTTFVVPVRQQP